MEDASSESEEEEGEEDGENEEEEQWEFVLARSGYFARLLLFHM
jgi:hypothetical protein